MFSGLFAKFYFAAGIFALVNYAYGEIRGAASSRTDSRPSLYSRSTGSGGSGGGGVFFGSGYRGGK